MSEAAVVFEAQTRTTTGTGSARELRRQGRVPAVVYGDNQNPIHISLPLKEVTLRANKKNFRSIVFELQLDGKKINAIAKDVQFNPVSDVVEHVDLQFISAKTAVKAIVPVIYSNQVKSPGLKRGGVLNVVRRDIEFFCNPGKIPAEIEIDLTGLEIGHAIHIEDLNLPEGVRPVVKRNFTLATIVGKGSDEPAANPNEVAGATTAAAAAKPAAGAAAKAPAAAAKPAAKK